MLGGKLYHCYCINQSNSSDFNRLGEMADKPNGTGPAAGGGEEKERPLGPDGKPIPGPEQMRQIQAARKMGQQQAQVEEVIGIMHKNVESV